MNNYVICKTASLRCGSVTGSDELPPADTLSEADFDAAFEKMENMELAGDSPTGSEDDVSEVIDTEDKVEEEKSDETVEQLNDDESEEDETADEQVDSTEDEIDDEDSANEKDSDESEDEDTNEETFSLENIPMDEELLFDISANGMSTRATMNQLITGFQKGLNYTKHMQQLKPFRVSIGIMEENGLTDSDLNLLVEAKSGNKDALGKLLADANLDPIDVETDNKGSYVPKQHGKATADPEMERVISSIKSDNEYGSAIQEALNNMPEDFYNKVSGSPENLEFLHDDFKNGIYQKVMPEVMKLQALYGAGDTMKMYIDTAKNMTANKPDDSGKDKPKPKAEATVKEKRKVVSTTKKKGAASKPVSKSLKDMDDDEFDKDFKRLYGDIEPL